MQQGLCFQMQLLQRAVHSTDPINHHVRDAGERSKQYLCKAKLVNLHHHYVTQRTNQTQWTQPPKISEQYSWWCAGPCLPTAWSPLKSHCSFILQVECCVSASIGWCYPQTSFPNPCRQGLYVSPLPHLRSAQPSPTQKGGVNAPFLNCTSEVTQWFLYINVTLLHKINEFGVKGVSGWLDLSLSLPERWHGVEMRVLARISSILLFPDRFRVKPYPSKHKKGGWKFAPKGQCVGLFAGQKWCISGNPGNTLLGHHLSVGSPSVCSLGMPCQVLWSGMLEMGRGGHRQLRIKENKDLCSAI